MLSTTKDSSRDIYYWDKKRAVALLSGKKVPMPNTLNALSDGSIHSIRENASPVKPTFENVTEPQQFKRWFGKSKVVNADGTYRLMTDAEYRVKLNAEVHINELAEVSKKMESSQCS